MLSKMKLVRDAIYALPYLLEAKKISDSVKSANEVLLYRIIPNPDKVNHYTIRDQGEYLWNLLEILFKDGVKLPFKTRVRIYKFYIKQISFLERINKAPKDYSSIRLEEEYKNASREAEEFIAGLAEIFDDPCLWISLYKKSGALSQCDIIKKWENSKLHESSLWLRKRCYIA